MKRTSALALLALGLAASGCGSTKKAVMLGATPYAPVRKTITITGTTTIANLEAGTRFKCKGWHGRGVHAGPPGSNMSVGQVTNPAGGEPSPSQQMRLTRPESGSMTVSCTQR
jgi:hypothetical protein